MAPSRSAKEARADFVVHGVEAELHTDGDGLVVSGTTSDPTWGKWELDRLVSSPGRREFPLTLKTTGMTFLRRCPIVCRSLCLLSGGRCSWEGKTPVELTVRFTPTTGKVSYRVAFEPKATKVQVTSIDLHAKDASGLVVVEDGVVHLRDVRGRCRRGDHNGGRHGFSSASRSTSAFRSPLIASTSRRCRRAGA